MSCQRFCFCHFLRPLWRGRNHFSGGSRNPALWFAWSSGSRYRDRFRAGTVPGAVRGGNARTAFARLIRNFTGAESNQNLEARKGLLFGLKRRPVNSTKTYVLQATPRAFIGSAMSTGRVWLDARAIVRAATGFSQSRARKAAIKSQAIIAQKTLVQEPVFSNNQAAPAPAKSAPIPLAV